MPAFVREDPTGRAIQLRLLRAASPARRFALARSLSASTIALARQAIRRRHPEWSNEDVLVEFVRIHYGADLAVGVRKCLAARRR